MWLFNVVSFQLNTSRSERTQAIVLASMELFRLVNKAEAPHYIKINKNMVADNKNATGLIAAYGHELH